MFLFLKLVLAHLIADFVLQFEELYQLKVRRFMGHLLHVLIHAGVTAILLFPYLNEPVILLFIAFLTGEHLLQDLTKYSLTQKFPAKKFLYYIVDQISHFAVLALIFLVPFANEARALPGSQSLNFLYRYPPITGLFIFFVLLTFAANYTLNSFYVSYVKGCRPFHWITSREMTVAIIERTAIAAAVILGRSPFLVALSLAAGLIRLPFKDLRSWRDFLLSAVYSLTLSYGFLACL